MSGSEGDGQGTPRFTQGHQAVAFCGLIKEDGIFICEAEHF